ncbi:MAG: CotH kinase family protein [Gammaproteobacteria bacterium]|nr:CotH kinase family protein [Gammaproteobacteria bacterium]
MTQNQATDQIRRSWWNRVVPVRLRHNLRLILGSITALILVGVMLGSFQVRPIVFSQTEMLPTITNNIEGNVDFFDLDIPHSVTLTVSDIAFDTMISDFKRFAEKTFVEVDAVIDGTLIRSVGIRLKGNSTLMGLSGRRPGGGAPPGPAAAGSGEGTTPPELTGSSAQGEQVPPAAASESTASETPAAPPFGVDPELMKKMFGLMGGVTDKDPSTLPLLLSFEEYFPGRAYQGRTELSLRPVAGGGASLNEALTLQLIEDSSQISQRYTWVTFSINGGETRTRLVLENPNHNYASSIGMGRGVLYKSRNSNAFKYHGEDPILYVEDFLQLNAIGSRDLAPVIRLLKWIDSASDEEFDTELSQWIDVPSFAKYVVTQDLMGNFDDMAGPGRNFLLWYDLDDKKFTVINWDMNLALVGLGDVFKGPINAAAQRDKSTSADVTPKPLAAVGSEPEKPAAPPRAAPARQLHFGNTLKDRFTGSEAFSELIASTRVELLESWFKSGHAVDVLLELSTSVPLSDKLSSEQISSQIASLTETISNKQ